MKKYLLDYITKLFIFINYIPDKNFLAYQNVGRPSIFKFLRKHQGLAKESFVKFVFQFAHCTIYKQIDKDEQVFLFLRGMELQQVGM